jgi:hypothetical protein
VVKFGAVSPTFSAATAGVAKPSARLAATNGMANFMGDVS